MLLLQHRGEPKAGWLRFTLVVGLVPNIDRKLNFEGFVPIGAVSRLSLSRPIWIWKSLETLIFLTGSVLNQVVGIVRGTEADCGKPH
jgi:hypothetical protein